MTVSATTAAWVNDGDGATTTFFYDNIIYAASDLKVYVDGALQTLTTDYSVTGVGVAAGGSVVFVTAPPAGTKNVVIVSDIPPTQGANPPSGQPFDTSGIIAQLDRITRQVQQVERDVTRAVRLADTDNPDGAGTVLGRLTDAATRANKQFTWDADGNPAVGALGDVATSDFMADVAQAATARAARALLMTWRAFDIREFGGGNGIDNAAAWAAAWAEAGAADYYMQLLFPEVADGTAYSFESQPATLTHHGGHRITGQAPNEVQLVKAYTGATGDEPFIHHLPTASGANFFIEDVNLYANSGANDGRAIEIGCAADQPNSWHHIRNVIVSPGFSGSFRVALYLDGTPNVATAGHKFADFYLENSIFQGDTYSAWMKSVGAMQAVSCSFNQAPFVLTGDNTAVGVGTSTQNNFLNCTWSHAVTIDNATRCQFSGEFGSDVTIASTASVKAGLPLKVGLPDKVPDKAPAAIAGLVKVLLVSVSAPASVASVPAPAGIAIAPAEV